MTEAAIYAVAEARKVRAGQGAQHFVGDEGISIGRARPQEPGVQD